MTGGTERFTIGLPHLSSEGLHVLPTRSVFAIAPKILSPCFTGLMVPRHWGSRAGVELFLQKRYPGWLRSNVSLALSGNGPARLNTSLMIPVSWSFAGYVTSLT